MNKTISRILAVTAAAVMTASTSVTAVAEYDDAKYIIERKNGVKVVVYDDDNPRDPDIMVIEPVMMLPNETHNINKDNTNAQNYTTYSRIVYSYLTELPDGYMRVQANRLNGYFNVEYYDKNFKHKKTLIIDEELSCFGAFYTDGKYYYILSGQNNPSESAKKEVYRLTKYDKNWKRLGSCAAKDVNTYMPLTGGSARITSNDKYIFIRTTRIRYLTYDGNRHQSNITLVVNKKTFKFEKTEKFPVNNYDLVGHSWNQFAIMDGNNPVFLDHGDANPRSIYMVRWGLDKEFQCCHMYKYPRTIDYQNTGCSIGGFEASDTMYIAAGNTVDQKKYEETLSRNIFIATTPKGTLETKSKITMITDYEDGGPVVSTPHLVKLSNNSFMLMWCRGYSLYYTKLDGSGKQIGKIYTADSSALSDCKPIVTSGGKIMWYTRYEERVTFYELDPKTMSVKQNASTSEGIKLDAPVITTCKLSGSGKSIIVKWKKTANAESYDPYISVYYDEIDEEGHEISVAKGVPFEVLSDNKVVVKNLRPNSEYCIRVRAFCKGTYSEFSQEFWIHVPDKTT